MIHYERMPTIRWDQIAREQMNPLVSRQVYHGEQVTIARIFLSAGAEVPLHQHANEQVTMMESGKLEFHFPDGPVLVEAGQFLPIPSNLPHRVVALEDSVAMDVFAPRREDWLRGDDAYLRR